MGILKTKVRLNQFHEEVMGQPDVTLAENPLGHPSEVESVEGRIKIAFDALTANSQSEEAGLNQMIDNFIENFTPESVNSISELSIMLENAETDILNGILSLQASHAQRFLSYEAKLDAIADDHKIKFRVNMSEDGGVGDIESVDFVDASGNIVGDFNGAEYKLYAVDLDGVLEDYFTNLGLDREDYQYDFRGAGGGLAGLPGQVIRNGQKSTHTNTIANLLGHHVDASGNVLPAYPVGDAVIEFFDENANAGEWGEFERVYFANLNLDDGQGDTGDILVVELNMRNIAHGIIIPPAPDMVSPWLDASGNAITPPWTQGLQPALSAFPADFIDPGTPSPQGLAGAIECLDIFDDSDPSLLGLIVSLGMGTLTEPDPGHMGVIHVVRHGGSLYDVNDTVMQIFDVTVPGEPGPMHWQFFEDSGASGNDYHNLRMRGFVTSQTAGLVLDASGNDITENYVLDGPYNGVNTWDTMTDGDLVDVYIY